MWLFETQFITKNGVIKTISGDRKRRKRHESHSGKYGQNRLYSFNGHGGKNHVWLDHGTVGEEYSDQMKRADAISYMEMGDALLARQAERAKHRGCEDIIGSVLFL